MVKFLFVGAVWLDMYCLADYYIVGHWFDSDRSISFPAKFTCPPLTMGWLYQLQYILLVDGAAGSLGYLTWERSPNLKCERINLEHCH